MAEGVTLIYGADTDVFKALVGKQASNIFSEIHGIFQVPQDSSIEINGTRPNSNYVLKDGDRVVFYKKSGGKGA